MKTSYFFAIIVCTGLLLPAAVQADIKYFADPPHKKLSDDDPPPMDEMVDLAKQGDTRAMFVLGDMAEKGKGGLVQDRKKARQWFEESAMHGYSQSFIRLAAMAKRDNNPKEAWQWYTLAINNLDNDDAQAYAIRARKALVAAAGLTSEDIDAARKSLDDWEEARDKYLRAERDAEREKERLEKEKAEQAEKAAANDSNNKTDEQENEDEQN